MPLLPTAQEWLTQSTLLLQARPSTTRITTKYSHPRLPNPKAPKSKEPKSLPTTNSTKQAQPTATLTLKTYDSVSGTTLKYNTNKSAEVSRLIQTLGRLARLMAGLPEDAAILDGKVEGEGGSGVGTPAVEVVDKQLGKTVPVVSGGGGGGKKKKGKGKK